MKLVPRFIGGVRTRGLATSQWCVIVTLAMVLFSGCATTKERGDRAFQANQYSQALDHYEIVIEKGSRDPDLYFKAAEAAVKVGDFSLAERYYSRSLRYGGGEEVARSMAEFYIATSNFTKAVRVLQELLETTDNPQSVFNNLGAALMYAGLPLDGESYLLVAQQMSPSDPVPYVNLGVLYDKHMNQPRLGLGFYRCFLRLSQSDAQRRKIAARVKSLEMLYGKEAGERFDVTCGEPYQPPRAPSADEVRERLGPMETSGEDTPQGQGEPKTEPSDTKSSEDEGAIQAPPDEEDVEQDDDAPPPVIYRQVDDIPAEDSSTDRASSGDDQTEPAELLGLAEEAFAKQNHKDVIRHLERLPASALDNRSMSLYGRSLAALGENERAQRWLAAAVAEDASVENVGALYEVYRKLGDAKRLHQLCERYDDDEALDEVLENCPKEQLIEHLKNKQQ